MTRRILLPLCISVVIHFTAGFLQAQDADDDGISDYDEVYSAVTNAGRKITDPGYSRSPLIQRSLLCTNAVTGLIVPDVSNRFDLTSWTLECWVRPATTNQNGAVVERITSGGETTFALCLVSGIPAVEFTQGGRIYRAGGQAGLHAPLPTNEWTHLAGVWDDDSDSLALYVNGGAEHSIWVWDACSLGSNATTKVGVSFDGYIDDLRVWDRPRTQSELDAGRWRFGDGALFNGGAGGSDDGLVAYYPFDDGGTNIEDFVHLNAWNYAFVGITTNAAYVDLVGYLDDDEDGIPDWWEQMFANGDADPSADTDADWLDNLYEYYSDTNPKFVDSDGDGEWDVDEDYDLDGVPNGDEQLGGSHPGLADTDDDGLSDLTELWAGYDPADSLSPLTWRALSCTGTAGDYLELPRASRFALTEWTLEAWVRPSSASDGAIVAREVAPGATNYFLGIRPDGKIQAGFSGAVVVSPFAVSVDGSRWTHLAATYTRSTRRLTLLIDGEQVATRICAVQPRVSGVGPITQRIGEGVNGLIDEVRLWSRPLTRNEIHDARGSSRTGGEANLVAYYRFDDGTSFQEGVSGTSLVASWTGGQVEDYVASFSEDWLNAWRNAASLHGGVTVTDLAAGENPITEDSDGDGMPDAWEVAAGLDPNDPADADEDPDFDGLINLYEYLADLVDPVGCDPWNPDTDGDNRSDYDEDSDGDGLSNGDEQDRYATDPGNVDTDDDTFGDGDEVDPAVLCGGRSVTSPTYSRSPLIQRSMVLDGQAYGIADPARSGLDQRFDASSWSLSCWVMPTNGIQDGTVIERVTDSGQTNFCLRLEAGSPVASFTTANGTEYRVGGGTVIPIGAWTRLEAIWAPGEKSLKLSVNGVTFQAQVSLESCARGWGTVAIGEGLAGCLDGLIITTGTVMQAEYLFDDAGVTAEDFQHSLDWNYALRGVRFCTNDYVTDLSVPDRDGDGLPDWWESLFFSGDASAAADGDDDGLSNLYEYYCDTNPTDDDSNGNGTLDGDEDADTDGLSNAEEEDLGADPRLADTDDDGRSDGTERIDGTDPANSLSPFRWRALELAGDVSSYVEMPMDPRFALIDWTIEAWVRPAASWSSAGDVLVRSVEPGETNYFLSVDASGVPRAGFGNTVVTAAVPIAADGTTWTHLAATYRSDSGVLSILVNGDVVDSVSSSSDPRWTGIGPVVQRLGQGFGGQIADVRLWSLARGDTEIADGMSTVPDGSESGLVAYYRFDDGTSYESGLAGTSLVPAWDVGQVQDFRTGFESDWLAAWAHGGTLRGGAALVEIESIDTPLTGDSDGDGMPDAWEVAYGLDPYDPSDADDDPDGDGLVNLYEYYCDTNPNDSNTDGDLLPDGEEDFDGDGLVNLLEQIFGVDPRLPDTDDDGVPDLSEVLSGYDPAESLSPLGWRALSLPGNPASYLEMPDEDRFALGEWTVEAWVRPDTGWLGGGYVLRRDVAPGIGNYWLGIGPDLRPVGGFGSTDVTAPDAMSVDGDTWTHLALTYNASESRMRLFVNGVQAASRTSILAPPTGVPGGGVVQRAGEGFDGLIDELRIWSVARDASAISAAMDSILTGSESGLVAYYRFDDDTSYVSGTAGTSLVLSWDSGQVEDFVSAYAGDWWTGWAHAASLRGTAGIETLESYEIPFDDDSDGDGMPDVWEIINGLDPADPDDANGDPDGDGLINLYEYYCGTDPNNSDSDGDTLPDGLEDYDSDGLVNIDEQTEGTDPRLPDTDDDGMADLAEVNGGYDATDSLSPLTWRGLALDGTAYAELPATGRFALDEWTLETWIRPVDGWGGGESILYRTVQSGITNYFLGVDGSGRPVAGFGSERLTGAGTLVADGVTWTHLAVTYQASGRLLKIYLDGVLVGSRACSSSPVVTGAGPVTQRLGEGLEGIIDDARIWSRARSESEIESTMFGALAGDESDLVAYYRFDDGTAYDAGVSGTSLIPSWDSGQVQDFVVAYASDWLTAWRNAASLRAGAVITNLSWADVPIGEDTDGDGMPDIWEIEHGLNPNDPSDADDDPDEDGLTNLYEYLSGTDPNDADSDDDGRWDGAEDSDGDGLENIDEQTHGTDPRLPDTDDDGVNDLAEKLASTDPADSLDPLSWRAASLPGEETAYVSMPIDTRFARPEWTIEAWVKPVSGWMGGGTVIRRDIETGEANYYMAIDNDLAVVAGFGGNSVTSSVSVAVDGDTWTHLAASYQTDGQWLRIYVDGELVASRVCSANPRTSGLGPVTQQIGAGFEGLIDEVRIWSSVRSQIDIRSTMELLLSGAEDDLVAYYRFDDGTSFEAGATGTSAMPGWTTGQVEDFVDDYGQNWWSRWADAATLHGTAVFTADGDGVPILPPGSVRVTLWPQAGITGAQWRVSMTNDWSDWQESGEIVLDLVPGVHTVNYANVTGWIAPSNELITITTTAAVDMVRYYAYLVADEGTALGDVNYPRGLAVSGDYLYIADSANHRILRLDTSSGTWVSYGEAGSGAGEFQQPFGIAVATNGDLYVADSRNNRVQRRTAATGAWTVWGGTAQGSSLGQFNGPFDVALDTNGNLYVTDHYENNQRVQRRSAGGTWTEFLANGFGDDDVKYPNGVSIDSSGKIYVTDHFDTRVPRSLLRTFDSAGALVERLGSSDATEGGLLKPMFMAFSLNDDLYVADMGNNRVMKSSGEAFDWSSVTASGFLKEPWGVAIDSQDRLYIADTGNNRVLRLDLASTSTPDVRSSTRYATGTRFQWTGKKGLTYTVEYKDSLSDDAWKTVSGYDAVTCDGGVLTCTDETADDVSQRFYRVRVK